MSKPYWWRILVLPLLMLLILLLVALKRYHPVQKHSIRTWHQLFPFLSISINNWHWDRSSLIHTSNVRNYDALIDLVIEFEYCLMVLQHQKTVELVISSLVKCLHMGLLQIDHKPKFDRVLDLPWYTNKYILLVFSDKSNHSNNPQFYLIVL